MRVGIIGAGNRGNTLIQMFQWLIQHKHAKVVAISDLKQEKVEKLNTHLKNVQPEGADMYFGDQEVFKSSIAKRDDIDLFFIIATPWEWHAKMCIWYGKRKTRCL